MIDPLDLAFTSSPTMLMEALATQSQAWLGQLASAGDSTRDGKTIGSFASATGYFVVRDRSGDRFAPALAFHIAADGTVRDDRGRAVLGYPMQRTTLPMPLRIPAAAPGIGPFVRFDIDERGVLSGIRRQTVGDPRETRIALGRLCIALFPAPQRLASTPSGTFAATVQSGRPFLLPADTVNLEGLERTPSSPALARFRNNAQQMWRASQRAEVDMALAAGLDVLDRVALDIVK
jgi:flagellar basal body rod protein FlgG